MIDARALHVWYFCSNPRCGRYIGGCLASCPGHASGSDHREVKIDSCHMCRHMDPNAAFLSKAQRRRLGLED